MRLISRALTFIKSPGFKKAIGYFLFFMVALVAVLYIRFPSEIFIPIIEKEVSRPPIRVTIGATSLAFPPGLVLSDVTVQEKSVERISIKSVTIRPAIMRALSGELGARITADILGGEISANGGIDSGPNRTVNVELELEGVNPGLAPIWADIPWGKLHASLSGEGAFTTPLNDYLKGEGALTINLADGVFKLGKIISIEGKEVLLDSGQVSLDYKHGKVTFKKAELLGDEVEVYLSGDIILARKMEFSRLNLEVSIKLAGELKSKLSAFLGFFKKDNSGTTIIKVNGVFRSPKVR